MDHVKAVEENLAERYLLQEMSAAETEEFEQHFFACTECAMAVEEGDSLVANTRDVLAETRVETRAAAHRPLPSQQPEPFLEALAAWWRKPSFLLPVAASVLFAVVALYQGAVVIRGLRQAAGAARILPAFQLTGASRGDSAQITVTPGTPFFAVSLDIPPDVHFPQYLCEFSLGNRTLFRLSSAAPVEGQPITILVPTNQIQAGQYQVLIYGADANGRQQDRISTFAFGIQLAGSETRQDSPRK